MVKQTKKTRSIKKSHLLAKKLADCPVKKNRQNEEIRKKRRKSKTV
jgi:hypothetical protein